MKSAFAHTPSECVAVLGTPVGYVVLGLLEYKCNNGNQVNEGSFT